jgi:hypothetical protein
VSSFFENVFKALPSVMGVASTLGIVPTNIIKAVEAVITPKPSPTLAPATTKTPSQVQVTQANNIPAAIISQLLPASMGFKLPGFGGTEIITPQPEKQTTTKVPASVRPMSGDELQEQIERASRSTGEIGGNEMESPDQPPIPDTLGPFLLNDFPEPQDDHDWSRFQPFLTSSTGYTKRIIFPAHEAWEASVDVMLNTNWLKGQKNDGRDKIPMALAFIPDKPGGNPLLGASVGTSPVQLPPPSPRLAVSLTNDTNASLSQLKDLFDARNP